MIKIRTILKLLKTYRITKCIYDTILRPQNQLFEVIFIIAAKRNVYAT